MVRWIGKNEHGKSTIHLGLLLTYFYKYKFDIKKYVLECKQEGEHMAILYLGKVQVLFTYFHRSKSQKVGLYLFDYTLNKTLEPYIIYIHPTL